MKLLFVRIESTMWKEQKGARLSFIDLNQLWIWAYQIDHVSWLKICKLTWRMTLYNIEWKYLGILCLCVPRTFDSSLYHPFGWSTDMEGKELQKTCGAFNVCVDCCTQKTAATLTTTQFSFTRVANASQSAESARTTLPSRHCFMFIIIIVINI